MINFVMTLTTLSYAVVDVVFTTRLSGIQSVIARLANILSPVLMTTVLLFLHKVYE